MAWLIPIVEGWLGPSFAKFARPLIWLAAALVIALAIWIGFRIHDSRVIAAHDAKQQVATVNADKKADDHAGDQRAVDVAREQHEKFQAQEAIDEARRNGADPRAAYYQCVRRQQAARSAGKPSPVC